MTILKNCANRMYTICLNFLLKKKNKYYINMKSGGEEKYKN